MTPRGGRRRLAVGALALSIAAAGIVLGALALWPPRSAEPAAPAGGDIAFDMDGDIHVMNSDGTGVRNLTGTQGVFESSPAWSPDGSRIARHSLHALDLETGEETRLFTAPRPQQEGVSIGGADWRHSP